MNARHYAENGTTYTRVSKARARKLYNKGVEIGIHPCNLALISPWGTSPVRMSDKSGRTFDAIVNEFEAYNCTTCETGKYATFYAPFPEAQV